MGEVLVATVRQMLPTAATMLAVLGCAKVMGYAGMIGAISSFCIAVTGACFPLMAPVIGAVGAFVTGSGTSSGLLFGSVQQQAAEALGMDPYWMVALNSLGVGAGKMILAPDARHRHGLGQGRRHRGQAAGARAAHRPRVHGAHGGAGHGRRGAAVALV